MVTAHWEAAVATVSSAAHPPMLYDYGGFPPETYRVVWPAPGDLALAARVRALLADAGLPSAEDPVRGFDHGTFVPLAVAWPLADVPTVQLSLVRGLDPELHLQIGRALAPLRDEGVLIVGSGMSYHDMRGFFTAAGASASEVFDAWLRDTVARPGPERDAALRGWALAPAGRACHPREEHLIPLMVAAGAAGDEVGVVPFSEHLLGVRVSAARWG
jgi:aromatic ring-opening dioxygenase catalytic subunit (LigB family)